MKNLFALFILLFMFSPYFSLAMGTESFQNYNQIVNDLNEQFKIKTTQPESIVQSFENSSYSIAIGFNGDIVNIYDQQENLFGLSGELGIYHLFEFPIKFGLNYSKDKEISVYKASLKSDTAIYTYNIWQVKIGLSTGMGFYSLKNNKEFNSVYISPSTSLFYQVNKFLDLSLNIDYSFHASNKVSNDFNPSLNLIGYF